MHPDCRRTYALATLVTAVLVLGGCDSGPDADAGGEASPGPSVIAPGKPGESAATLSAKDAAERRADDDTPNSADFAYTQMMIEHHGQALTMTGLAPERASSAEVKRLASRIGAAQKPEIGAMKRWLKSHGGPREQHGHDHATMPGMASEAQLRQLRAARGETFDQLFLKLMITHHSGAVTMAADALSEGNNIQVEEMANDVIAQQTSEIGRMRKMG
ncbi:DUF305 domain-containing protein [Streptomyces alfalfae]|uniref:DUF305 domain-containing protein n=1 Tax=Streptomyces alfalfae TaxID=1642299 RepID=A0ABN4VPQ6_9ACTN|nr:DUF305 domain-containing protein [Streptomyces alfalfae]AYA19904.1 DUF305 domain-containing protein [Streptomyces fradiae]APY89471.1 DUF305 domain-containing protein [Streptomyces alfalfae]QUI30499.1 DUF305 domain-containing protein [Streptomyces alfalfae]RXX44239.1 DUF305 domain-containing protein [Streptomyces alfalfae]RZM99031.1 DUF305 domain-containing protein [Streptomyces alfalfae]